MTLVEKMKEFFKLVFKFDMKGLFIEPSTNIVIQMFRYLFAGGFAFIADSGSLYIIEKFGIHYMIAAIFGFVIGLFVNYILSKLLVFKANVSKTSNKVEFVIFGVIGVIGLGITEIIMYIFTKKLRLYFMISKIISAVIVLFWNFIARKVILYRN